MSVKLVVRMDDQTYQEIQTLFKSHGANESYDKYLPKDHWAVKLVWVILGAMLLSGIFNVSLYTSMAKNSTNIENIKEDIQEVKTLASDIDKLLRVQE